MSLARGWFLAAALTTRAHVEIAEGELDRAERDSYDALAIAASGQGDLLVPGILECLADIAGDAGSHREAARYFGAADAARQRMGAVRLKVLDADHEGLGGAATGCDGRQRI